MQIMNVIEDWRAHRVHYSLFGMTNLNLPSDCTSEHYIPLTCRYDNNTNILSLTVFSRVDDKEMSFALIQFIYRYHAILTLLLAFSGIAIIIFIVKQNRSRPDSTRLPLWNSDDSLPPPQPLITRHARNVRG